MKKSYAKNVLPINKLYNKEKTNKLLDGFDVQEQIYYKFDPNGKYGLK